ncbi:MAG TPA: hypothetical protein G4O12_08795 [Dehalococcoidia bacterium]|nr:hypothetical protein [Dehalococcoidia bacterium]
MGEIKSTWEIAQEKASKLGELSLEEQKKQREDRCRPIGKSLAEKYLSEHDTQHLEAELSKYNSEDKELISQTALHQLIEGIDLRRGSILDRMSQGILSLAKTETAAEIVGKIKELFQEYQEAEKGERQDIEKAGREILHQLRISGTAISQINIRAKGEWQEKLDKVVHPTKERLNRLKQELLK